jgi:hypothetical protein
MVVALVEAAAIMEAAALTVEMVEEWMAMEVMAVMVEVDTIIIIAAMVVAVSLTPSQPFQPLPPVKRHKGFHSEKLLRYRQT